MLDGDEPSTSAEFRGVVERIESDPTGAFYKAQAEHYGVPRRHPDDSHVIFSVKIRHIVGQNL